MYRHRTQLARTGAQISVTPRCKAGSKDRAGGGGPPAPRLVLKDGNGGQGGFWTCAIPPDHLKHSRTAAWIPVGIFFVRHVYSLATITGGSMQPTLNPNLSTSPLHHDVVLLERWSVGLRRFARGDVVTLWSPQNPDLLTTKRIVAVPGDLVTPLPPSPPTPVRIPPGHVWVEGDSRFNTLDSNTYGPIPLALVDAKVIYVLWPWARTGAVEAGMGKSKGRVRRFGGQLV